MNIEILSGAILLAALALITGWWLWVRRAARRTNAQARRQAAKILEEAEREKSAKLREAEVAAKEKLLAARNEFEKASRKRRDEIEALERRLTQKEDHLEKRFEELEGYRDFVRAHGVVDPELVGTLVRRIEEVFGTPTRMVRFRSSSNIEDALEFNGAGLYESTFSLAVIDPISLFGMLLGGPLLGLAGAWLAVGRHLAQVQPE